MHFLLFLVVIGFWLGGCAAWKESQVPFARGSYRLALKGDLLGTAAEEELLRKLGEMTVEDYERLGDYYVRHGNLTMAFLQYDRALRLDPARARARYKTGLLFLKKGLPEDARHQFQLALGDDTAPDSVKALAHAGLGQAFFTMMDDAAAEKHFRQAVELAPTLWKTHNFLGIIYDRQRRHHEAIAEYQAGLGLNPAEPALLNNLGMSYYLLGQYEEAVRAFELALKAGSTETRVINNLGLALGKLERYHEALEVLKKGNQVERAYNNVGMMYLKAGKPYQAIACFERAIEIKPSYYVKAQENLKQARLVLTRQSSQAPGRDRRDTPRRGSCAGGWRAAVTSMAVPLAEPSAGASAARTGHPPAKTPIKAPAGVRSGCRSRTTASCPSQTKRADIPGPSPDLRQVSSRSRAPSPRPSH